MAKKSEKTISKKKLSNNVAVIGFGVTGKSVAKFLTSRGHIVTVFESGKKDKFNPADLAKYSTVEFYFETTDFDPKQFDYIVTSPGVSLESPVIVRAQKMRIPVYNDLTLFIDEWRKKGGKIIGVTGSNGKTTTVSLLYEIIKQLTPAILGGNIGNSPLDLLDIEYPRGVIAVLEISSNQLDLFGPADYLDICVVTNLSSNHLDRYHGSMDEYAFAKLKGIDKNKTKTIICLDDIGTQKHILPQLKCKNIYAVSFEQPVDQAIFSGIYTDESGNLIFADVSNNGSGHAKDFPATENTLTNNFESEIVFDKTDKRRLIGLHNLYNIAFVLLTIILAEKEITKKTTDAIRNFVGLEHRIEKVLEKKGVLFVNDSKSTSPDSIRVALEAVGKENNVLLIVGGDDKDMSFDFLAPIVAEKVKKMIITPGNIQDKLTRLAKKSEVEFFCVDDLGGAVKLSHKNASPGDVVLLSPGSYSKNIFKNYEDRGNQFKKIVMEL
ncbi:MAG TPA: UDP-N-acetylmuramoyl-L-alanine--D-glutamate ligase [Candidatus Paceibacterota bacterium]|nr:UDP-N-acetylmuramoyl-L-alanine--D-glutamate ligase [Candidatus Paceibacterota bacterium]